MNSTTHLRGAKRCNIYPIDAGHVIQQSKCQCVVGDEDEGRDQEGSE